MTDVDLDNMRLRLRLKLERQSKLREMLVKTGETLIVDDFTRLQSGSGLFWGATFITSQWMSLNWLVRLWMELRQQQMSGLSSVA